MTVLESLAANPALPAELLLRLLGPPTTPAGRWAVMVRADLTDEVVDAVVNHPELQVRAALAENAHVSAETRSRLATDPAMTVRWTLAEGPLWDRFQHATTPLTDAAYDLLARDVSVNVRHPLASSPLTPPWVLSVLADDPEESVRQAVCGHWDALTTETRQTLLRTTRRTALLADYREHLDEIIANGDATELLDTAPLPRAIAERYARSPESTHRRASAANPHLERDLLQELANDPSPDVRFEVSMRAGLTEEERAAIDYDPDLYRVHCPLPWIRERFDVPEWMEALTRSAHPVLRRSAACNPRLSPDLVRLLAQDGDQAVRLLLAENHPDAPAELLLRVVLEDAGYSEGELTSRSQFPRAGLAAWAEVYEPVKRRLALLDPELSAESVERLSHDRDERVRLSATKDRRLPTDRLLQLLRGADQELAEAAAANPGLPLETMIELVVKTTT